MFWLWLSLTSFTTDFQITVREILIPFETAEQCQAARVGIVTNVRANIGVPSDGAGCVTISDGEELRRLTEAWPDQSTHDEKVAKEKARIKAFIEERDRFKAEYDKHH
jgi:hypothetical protein